MRTSLAILLAALASTAPVLPEDSVATAPDYVGRWNVRILNSGDTFFSSWLKVVAVDGALQGTLVWKWGGVTKLEDVAVSGGELRFRRGGESFRARLVGDDLLGVAVMGENAKFYFVGRRAPEMADVGGTWKITPRRSFGLSRLRMRPNDPAAEGFWL